MSKATAKIASKIGPASQARSFATADGRTRIGKRLRATEVALAKQLGGERTLSAVTKALVRIAAVKMLRIDLLSDEVLRGVASPEDERRLCWYSNSLQRDFKALGLDPTRPVAEEEVDLEMYLDRFANARARIGEQVAEPDPALSPPERAQLGAALALDREDVWQDLLSLAREPVPEPAPLPVDDDAPGGQEIATLGDHVLEPPAAATRTGRHRAQAGATRDADASQRHPHPVFSRKARDGG
ncbi:MAG: hypothetical protein AB7G10_24720 [Reyranellaceae bacterium]